jgi:hypothetical protein
MPAKRTLKGAYRVVPVKITEELIAQAEEKNSKHCMIADAIRAAIPHAKAVSVDLATIRFTDPEKGQRYLYLTPPSVQAALINFDQGVHTKPFEFRLHKAAWVVEAGYKAKPDGSRKRASQAQQGIVGASGRNQPIRLGGRLPARDKLTNVASKSTTKAEPKEAAPATGRQRRTKAETYAADLAAAKKAAAARAQGKPADPKASNLTMAPTGGGKVREFGLKQLRA